MGAKSKVATKPNKFNNLACWQAGIWCVPYSQHYCLEPLSISKASLNLLHW